MSMQCPVIMLYFFLMLFTLKAAVGKDCSYIYDEEPYTRTKILELKREAKTQSYPSNLLCNPKTGDLHYTIRTRETSVRIFMKESYERHEHFVMTNGKSIKINDADGVGVALDLVNDNTYLGTTDGVKILSNVNKVENFMFPKKIIQALFLTEKLDLYVSALDDYKINIINLRSNATRVIDKICARAIVVDSKNNLYYSGCDYGARLLLNDFKVSISFVGLTTTVTALAKDEYNRTVAATNDGLYHLRPDNIIPKKLMSLNPLLGGIMGIAFCRGDIYYSERSLLYKLSKC